MANPIAAANGLSSVRSSVAGVRERTVLLRRTTAGQVRSTAAAEAVAELGLSNITVL